jgi:3-oxoacyl-[acyl-carrier protein] reductase
MTPIDLSNKVALVTGSSRGIGRAIAEEMARAGAAIVVNGRSESADLTALAERLGRAHGVKAKALACNVADGKQVSAMMSAVFKEFGRLDVLVNNAGILRDGLIGMIREQDIAETIGINTVGVINCIQAGARLIQRAGGGSIINVTSIIGVRGNKGQLVYGASKGAVITATLSAAKELAAKNIRVNAIAPGYIDTDMIRAIPPAQHEERLASIAMGRIGRAEDIAGAALFLASDLSTYVTGQVIGVDGGMLI